MKNSTPRWLGIVMTPLVLGGLLALWAVRMQKQERRLEEFLESNVGEAEIVIVLLTDTSKIERLEHMRVVVAETVFWNDVVGFPGAWIVGTGKEMIPVLGDVSVTEIGPYRIHHLDMSGEWLEDGGFDLVANLPLASVQRVDTKLHPCPLSAGLFACEGEPWFSVSLRRVLMGNVGFECIYAHPKNHSRLHIVYPTTSGGSALTITGGIDDDGVNYPQGEEVIVTVSSGSRVLGSVVFENLPGLQEKTIAFSEPLPAHSPLVIEITSENQDTRHFCFRGWIHDSRPAAP